MPVFHLDGTTNADGNYVIHLAQCADRQVRPYTIRLGTIGNKTAAINAARQYYENTVICPKCIPNR